MLTPWNYEVDGDLPPIIDPDAFDSLTGGSLRVPDEQKAAVLAGVSAAVRSWCGWHVSPVLECSFTGEGTGRLLFLPAARVIGVSSLEVLGNPAEFEWRPNGTVRLARGAFPDKWGSARCSYTAGVDAECIGSIVAQVASNALAAAPGIAEEHAGGVGATYNKTGDGITGGVSLLARDKELLAPFRIAGTVIA